MTNWWKCLPIFETGSNLPPLTILVTPPSLPQISVVVFTSTIYMFPFAKQNSVSFQLESLNYTFAVYFEFCV